ncbi:hypothetical protein CAP35_04590 [Chitinophagaceae bacterium IBVUCB1]|nr:hypothetical protein CAP35_04590 [Chitinophagaceae bacterium IBVUCB1]
MKPLYWLFLMLIIVSIPIFAHLDELPLQLWDESRLAVNALEMTQTGNMLVTTYEYLPDMWNVKPPLMVWLIAASMKLFGYNEFAVRFPSAIITLLTCMFLFRFMHKNTGNARLAFLSCIILISCEGYVRLHGTRTGDYDVLLTLCTTAYLFNYYLFIENNSNKHLLYFFIFLTLAVFTKSIAGLMFLPALLLYTLWKKKLFSVFKTKYFYLGLLVFIAVLVSYYLMREDKNPGYLQSVWDNELGGRYGSAIEYHKEKPNFYLLQLIQHKYKYWMLITILPIIFFYNKIKNDLSPLFHFLLLSSLSFLLVISNAGTKLSWYDMPVYPLLAIITALSIECLISLLSYNTMQIKAKVFTIFIIILAFLIPYIDVTAKCFTPEYDKFYEQNHYMAFFMARALRGQQNINNCIFTGDSKRDQNIVFYINIQKEEKGLRYKNLLQLDAGDKVVLFYKAQIDSLEDMYSSNITDSFANVKVFQINGKK